MTTKTLHGTVTISVGDETYTLTPTLGAVRAIEARFGGLLGAVRAVDGYSVDGIAHIIAAGAQLDAEQAAGLPDLVWQAGIVGVGQQLVPYVAALLNPKAGAADEGNAAPKARAKAQ